MKHLPLRLNRILLPYIPAAAVKKISTGNFTDNMKDIANYDWIIEVVVERLDIKPGCLTKWKNTESPEH